MGSQLTWAVLKEAFAVLPAGTNSVLEGVRQKFENNQIIDEELPEHFEPKISINYNPSQSLRVLFEPHRDMLVDGKYKSIELTATPSVDISKWNLNVDMHSAIGEQVGIEKASKLLGFDNLKKFLHHKLLHYAHQKYNPVTGMLLDKIIAIAIRLKMTEDEDTHAMAHLDDSLAPKLAKPLCEFEKMGELLTFMNSLIKIKRTERKGRSIGLKELVAAALLQLYRGVKTD